ncbi:MAG TPA: response regulator transcription factor [Tissierellaceae bacterium]
MYKIMIVEDDKKISSMISEELKKYNYETYIPTDYEKILDGFIKEEPDLVLLDINLPKYDGFYWCKEIRKISKVPIIYISARFSEMDQVLALEKGGDDYVIKPFSFDILLVKIKSLLRRTYGEYSLKNDSNILNSQGLVLNKDKNTISFKDKSIELSNKEFRLIQILAENIGNIVSREELLEELWDDVSFVDDNTLSVNITRIRKQLAKLGIFDAVVTKRGLGYILEDTWSD